MQRFGSREAIPGPPGHTRFRNFFAFRDQPTDFLLGLVRDHGPVVRFDLGPTSALLVTEPELVEQILLTKQSHYGHGQGREDMKLLLGEGLLTAQGDDWKRARKLMSPPLRKRQIDHYADVMVARTRAYVDDLPPDTTRDITADTMGLALHIVVDTLFGMDAPPGTERVGHLVESGMHYFEQRIRGVLRFLPRWWPSRARARFFADLGELNRLVYALIDARRGETTRGDDLLSRLLEARYDDGAPMSEAELRDQVITMFLAGHETTALALAYALHLIGAHPEVQARLHAEIDDVLGASPATAEQAVSLPYCRAVFHETLRVCPPAWAATRRAIRDTTLGPYALPKGSVVFYAPFVTHRQARFFEDPETFAPERWLDGLEQQLPRFAFLPFGGGPRICIGNHFALLEGALVLATLFQHLHVEAPTTSLSFEPSVTLRPASPIRLKVRRRA